MYGWQDSGLGSNEVQSLLQWREYSGKGHNSMKGDATWISVTSDLQ